MPGSKVFALEHRSMYLNSLGDSLCQLGHQLYYQSSWDLEEIEAGIAYFKPDILLTVGCDIPLRNPALSVLPELCRKYRLIHVYWATEDNIQFENWSKVFVGRTRPDVVWTIHPDCLDWYRQNGMVAEYLNFGFNPRLFPAKGWFPQEDLGVTFVGTPHLHVDSYRFESLRHLLFSLVKEGIPVNVWGYSWVEMAEELSRIFGASVPAEWVHGVLPYKHSANIYRRSKIVLGVQNALDQVTQRTFEIIGTGAFMIASRTPEMERLFVDREDLAFSSSPEETIALVRHYLQHPGERHRIGMKGRSKVIRDHLLTTQLAKIWPSTESLTAAKGGLMP